MCLCLNTAQSIFSCQAGAGWSASGGCGGGDAAPAGLPGTSAMVDLGDPGASVMVGLADAGRLRTPSMTPLVNPASMPYAAGNGGHVVSGQHTAPSEGATMGWRAREGTHRQALAQISRLFSVRRGVKQLVQLGLAVGVLDCTRARASASKAGRGSV